MKKQQEEFKIIKAELTDEEIKEFEKELERYKLSVVLENPLDYFGVPLRNQDKFPGFINNQILGGVHWSVVNYCLENKIIGKNRFGSWFVAAEVYERKPGGRCETNAYNRFIEKWRGLNDLKNRRLYAADIETERFGGERLERIRKILENKKFNWN